MRNNTQAIFERLSRGEFIVSDSNELDVKHLYDELEENFEDYESYFEEIGYRVERGVGYFYFSRIGENKVTAEQKLTAFGRWVDYLDFLKTFDVSFGVGYTFRKSTIVDQMSQDVELREKIRLLSNKATSNEEKVDALLQELLKVRFVELINELDGSYKVTAAFRYAEELVNLLTIYNEDEIPE